MEKLEIEHETKELNLEEVYKNRAKRYNDEFGVLDEIDCPICKNKGNIMNTTKYTDKFYVNTIVECQCMKKRKQIRKARQSGLGEYVTKRFEDFETSLEWQKLIKSKAMEYCKGYIDEWFVALGQSGSGKTLISSIIANYMMVVNDFDLMYITWTDFISKTKAQMMGDETMEAYDYLSKVKNVECLFVDELLKKYNDTDLKYIIEIINYRYTNNLQTIITSERTIDELLDIDEATFGRVIEKSNKYLVQIGKDRKKNYRLRGVI